MWKDTGPGSLYLFALFMLFNSLLMSLSKVSLHYVMTDRKQRSHVKLDEPGLNPTSVIYMSSQASYLAHKSEFSPG